MATLPDIRSYLHTKQGFCHPDWEGMADLIERQLPESEWSVAWEAAARLWVERLRETLGGAYQILETPHFLILTEAPSSVGEDACTTCESALKSINHTFRGVASASGNGKHVILMFERSDDYYRYILYFYPDGHHPMSSGVYLRGEGYEHIALLTEDYSSYRTVLVHELTHNCLSHLKPPTWLNEALAMRMERAICGTDAYPLDRELRDRHVKHWNPQTIQQFWSGKSWDIPGDSSELSYSLAQLLWQTIESELHAPPEALMAFIASARYDTGGEESFQMIFDLGLGDLVTEFLGEGKWEPRPKSWGLRALPPNANIPLRG
jgi:hypothetical protein